uniref:Putative DsRNA-binding domain-like superfamily protein isoform 2 n=1 Tax=Davidia involucrata TaxID=16924 RepID=A0A5B7B6P4_DAVIN
MSTNDGFQGVSNCYVFKSRLQEYAQKVGLPTPVYETIKEGPSHEPSFRSTVIVDNVRYDSLPGFFNRKAAEQSAAEVALMELANSRDMNERISQPVHETGLCKNLLQEYAQKMNYAIPLYECQKDEKPGRVPLFSCIAEIGGIKYIGAAARTKKEAEIKAARTALIAIQSSASESNEKHTGNSPYTVIPCKKKVTDLGVNSQETVTSLKPKKGCFKKKSCKKRRAGERGKNIQVENLDVNMDGQAGQELDQTDSSGVEVADSKLLVTEVMRNFQDKTSTFDDGKEREVSAVEGALVPHNSGDSKDGQLTALNFCENDLGTLKPGITSMFHGDDLTALVKEVNKISGVGQVASMVNNSSTCQGEVPSVVDGLNQMAYRGNTGSN